MKRFFFVQIILLSAALLLHCQKTSNPGDAAIAMHYPQLQTNLPVINDASRIAFGDLMTNVQLYKNGLLQKPSFVIFAGLDYNRPWTRDASINAWNGASLIIPKVSENTLLSVLKKDDDEIQIDGQYWDCIVWATGAWNHYLYTGDKEFLDIAYKATKNTLRHLEETEFDPKYHLFRGPGWSDGIAAYPDFYANTNGESGILCWPKYNADKISRPGYGIPMMAMSTNCLYYNAYVVAQKMAAALGLAHNGKYLEKAEKLKKAINERLWDKETKTYNFFIDPYNDYHYQEALGNAYAIIFGIAGERQKKLIFINQHVAPAGVPCVWPNVPRYNSKDGMSFGRHSGTVWPQIQGFWADAAARKGRVDIFSHELFNLANHARRDKQFAEIYHPITGQIYGGLQERRPKGIVLWRATSRQTWAATAYIRMIYMGLIGMRFDTDGIRFQPCVPDKFNEIKLTHFHYRNADIDIEIIGQGNKIEHVTLNGKPAQEAFIPAKASSRQKIVIKMTEPF